MTFPWQTEKARREQERGEEFARRAVADYCRNMADILDKQSRVNVLRPAKAKRRPVDRLPVNNGNCGD